MLSRLRAPCWQKLGDLATVRFAIVGFDAAGDEFEEKKVLPGLL